LQVFIYLTVPPIRYGGMQCGKVLSRHQHNDMGDPYSSRSVQ
jgi:hypothetical protein